MSEVKRGPGRPRTREDEPAGEYVGFRAPRALKAQLVEAAAREGRSLSTEAQFRIQQTFDFQKLLPQLLDLAYGKETAGLLLLLGQILRRIQFITEHIQKLDSADPARGSWFEHGWAYGQVREAILEILRRLEPASKPVEPKPVTDHPQAEYLRDVGKATAMSALASAIDNSRFDDLEPVGDEIRNRLRMSIKRLKENRAWQGVSFAAAGDRGGSNSKQENEILRPARGERATSPSTARRSKRRPS